MVGPPWGVTSSWYAASAFMPSTGTEIEPPSTCMVVSVRTVGAVTGVCLPEPGVARTRTSTFGPKDSSPSTRTVLSPQSPPNTTLTIWRLES
ncbi:hypothetical protein GCM10029992_17830 [Glycomyces albus]